jgi:hypothetical protein
MPASIAHMLIAHKALQKLKGKGVREFAEFAEMLDNSNKKFKAYVNLGSNGPDLYYYAEIISNLKDMLKERTVQSTGVTPWAYHLHSQKPNEFPLRLVKIVFSDALREGKKVKLEDDDIRKLAYIAGHLTHIAADQIIHPVVNSAAGPYYRSGENRRKHRQCEVFQDYFLYDGVYRLEEKSGAKYDFFKQKFNKWVDCVPAISTRNTEDWFRYFLQRGFAETYSTFPTEKEIEDSVDNLLLALRTCQVLGPYREAAEDYQKKGESGMFREYIKDVDYIRHYRLAVELAVVYLIALYEVYFVLKKGGDFTEQHEERFRSIVSDADLSCPLEQDILEKAYAALTNKKSMEQAIEKHFPPLLGKTKLLTTKGIIKASSDRDIVNA